MSEQNRLNYRSKNSQGLDDCLRRITSPPPQKPKETCDCGVCETFCAFIISLAILSILFGIICLIVLTYLFIACPSIMLTITGSGIVGAFLSATLSESELKKVVKRSQEALAKQKKREKKDLVSNNNNTKNEKGQRFLGYMSLEEAKEQRNQWKQERRQIKSEISDLRLKLDHLITSLNFEVVKPVVERKRGLLEILRKPLLIPLFSGFISNGWSKRYFILKEGLLVSYKNDDYQVRDDVIVLEKPEFEKCNQQIDKRNFCLKILLPSSKKEVVLSCSSAKERDEWFYAFTTDKLTAQDSTIVKISYPPNWEEPLKTFKKILLNPKSEEFLKIEKYMKSSIVNHYGSNLNNISIISLYRIQNPILYEKYFFTKNILLKKYYGDQSQVDERLLFHGSNYEIIDEIISHGFDPRVSSFSGMFGAGVYFAQNSSKSHQYTTPKGKIYRMLVCNVLIGRPAILCHADNSLRKPPQDFKSSVSSDKYFDSVIGESKEFNPKASLNYREFIVYNMDQAYPQYLVEYEPK